MCSVFDLAFFNSIQGLPVRTLRQCGSSSMPTTMDTGSCCVDCSKLHNNPPPEISAPGSPPYLHKCVQPSDPEQWQNVVCPTPPVADVVELDGGDSSTDAASVWKRVLKGHPRTKSCSLIIIVPFLVIFLIEVLNL